MADETFKAKLLSDPNAALTETGIEVPAGLTLKVVEDSKDTQHLVLRKAPEGELSEEDLTRIGGGCISQLCDWSFPIDKS